MKAFFTYLKVHYVIFLISILLPVLIAGQDQKPKKIIYETDMCLDVDDAGGLAILHAMANNGEAEILAVCFNEIHPNGAAAIDAMNTWYGRGDIPVGVYKKNLANPDGSGYLSYVAKYPNDLTNEAAPNALDVYREVLAAQPDSSVTIISVGFLNNINDLLLAEPELVSKKVLELVQMAGVNNDGFNLVRHNLVSVSENVIKNWPTKMVISQAGGDIYTGENYRYAAQENPFREAFYRFFGGNYNGRSSWDEMAVLYGVRGVSPYFNEITTGTGSLSNGYVWQMKPGFRSYLGTRYSNSTYVQIIEDLMDQLPFGARFELSAKSGWLPFSVDLDASKSSVPHPGFIEKYLWSFGDGNSGEGMMISHEYTSAGNFDIQLTVIDDLDDSLQAFEQIQVSDPVFSADEFFGNVQNYTFNQHDLWTTQEKADDLRLFLNSGLRESDLPMAGYCFIEDSIYGGFTMNFEAATGEDLSQNSLADYSIIFGYEDSKNYNQLLMKHTTSRLISYINGRSTAIKWTTQPGIPDQHFHAIAVNLSGDEMKVTLDDSTFLEASSSRLLKQGKIGFGSGQYGVFFDNICISGKAITTISHNADKTAKKFVLGQNYPNPFNPKTTISFTLQYSEIVKINVYTLLGQNVETLINKLLPAGDHEIAFNAQGLNSGVYFYKIQVGNNWDVKKMILLR